MHILTTIIFSFFLFTSPSFANSKGADSSSHAEATTQATWQERTVRFWYTGSNTHYTCDAIEQRLETLLEYFGAKEDPSVRAYSCLGAPRFSSQDISVSMKFSVPVELSSSERSGESFTAQRRPIIVTSRRPRLMESFDCELIDSFARQVLPSFEHEIVRNSTACFRTNSYLQTWLLEADVLSPTTI